MPIKSAGSISGSSAFAIEARCGIENKLNLRTGDRVEIVFTEKMANKSLQIEVEGLFKKTGTVKGASCGSVTIELDFPRRNYSVFRSLIAVGVHRLRKLSN